MEKVTNHCSGEECLEFPEYMCEEGRDLINSCLKKDPQERLGGGHQGSSTDFDALQAHKFFAGTRWNDLMNTDPPLLPNLAPLPPPEKMSDGAFRDWLFDLGEVAGALSPCMRGYESSDSDPGQCWEEDAGHTTPPPSVEYTGAEAGDQGQHEKWRDLLYLSEEVVYAGLLYLRGFMGSRRKRELVLTSTPRLFFVVPGSTNSKDIPWTREAPVSVQLKTDTTFNVVSGQKKFAFIDPKGSQTWVDVIESVLTETEGYR
uniref:PDK1-type PH domain-containing protein n=1 Tax=Fibrocapsa japonica TaxID=94617 RepID=A0A7S2XYP6_9STRA